MEYSGVLLVNKEKGMGSTKVVSKVRKALNTRDVGHCGTLDPLAEGLLIVTIGKALKISRFLESDTKEYVTTVYNDLKDILYLQTTLLTELQM